MKREVAGNTFQDGLQMDMNDFSKSNSTLASCLNGTLVTFNGNEYVLQNDLGNGRVETAYLPENYVPLGTASYGGIIYIVSYNPKDNKCQIGSFPSPERNISSDEIDSKDYKLSANDFIHNNVVDTFVVEKKLGDTLYSPGDFFLITGTNLAGNVDQIFDPNGNNTVNTTLKLSLGSMSEDGKVTILTNVKTYTISGKKVILAPQENIPEGQSPTVEEYRSVISQPYNVFSSKERGKLVLIAELLCCDSFTISVKNAFNDLGNYAPTITHYIEGNNYVYTGYNWVIKDSNNRELSKGEVIRFGTFVTDGKSRTGFNTINTKISSTYNEIITLEVTPTMNWGEATFLKQTKTIDLSKIGTGAIKLSQWKYYNDSSKCTIQWALNTYLEETQYIDNVSMTFKRITDFVGEESNRTYTTETLSYVISKKSDYNSTFYENIPLDTEYYKLTNNGKTGILVSDKLYLATITITKKDTENPEDSEEQKFYRWILTNSMFNEYYKTESDFDSLTLDIPVNMESTSTLYDTAGEVRHKLGDLKDYYDKDDNTTARTADTTASIAVTDVKCVPNIIITPIIKNTSLFKCILEEGSSSNICSIGVDTANSYKLSIQGDKTYIYGTGDRPSSEFDDYISTNIIGEGDFDEITQEKLNEYTYKQDRNYTNDFGFIKSSSSTQGEVQNPLSLEFKIKDNKLVLNTVYKLTLQLISKAICNLRKDSKTSIGSFKPLAYNNQTYSQYNLIWYKNNYIPLKIGTFSVHERSGVKGTATTGVFYPSIQNEVIKSTALSTYQAKREDNLSINFGEQDMITGMQRANWDKGAMFISNIGSAFNNILNTDNNSDINTSNENFWYIIDNSSIRLNIFSGDPSADIDDVWKKAVVMIALKDNNGTNAYWPINCAVSNKLGDEIRILGKSEEELVKYFTFEKFLRFYQYFAYVLNTLYKYNTDSITKKVEYPNTIIYNKNEKAILKLTLNLASSDFRHSLGINVSNTKYLPLSTYINALGGNRFKYNDPIQLSISTDLSYKFNGSTLLRDYMLEAQNIINGAAILDYDGSTFLGFQNITPDPATLYSRIYKTTGGIIESPTNEIEAANHTAVIGRPKDINGNPLPVEDNTDVSAYSGQFINFNNNFCLKEGLLVIKSLNPTGVILKRTSNGDDGYVEGFQTVGFDDWFRPFRPTVNESY